MPSPTIILALTAAALLALPVIAGGMASAFPSKRRAPQGCATEEGAASDDFISDKEALMRFRDARDAFIKSGFRKGSSDVITLDHCVTRPSWERFRNQPIRRGGK